MPFPSFSLSLPYPPSHPLFSDPPLLGLYFFPISLIHVIYELTWQSNRIGLLHIPFHISVHNFYIK